MRTLLAALFLLLAAPLQAEKGAVTLSNGISFQPPVEFEKGKTMNGPPLPFLVLNQGNLSAICQLDLLPPGDPGRPELEAAKSASDFTALWNVNYDRKEMEPVQVSELKIGGRRFRLARTATKEDPDRLVNDEKALVFCLGPVDGDFFFAQCIITATGAAPEDRKAARQLAEAFVASLKTVRFPEKTSAPVGEE